MTRPNVEDKLRGFEPIFHRPELGTSRADFADLTDDGFCEVGASGRRCVRARRVDILEAAIGSARRRRI